jgi:cold shock CspA family protein
VVEAHYFRGRFSAEEVQAAGKLFSERVFEDVLVREGVTTHYLPMGHAGTEKGIDVWFALEAFERAIDGRFDVCVLVAGDSDYVPLARKLSGRGTRVMVVGWDFEYADRNERLRTTRTSQALLGAVTYPVLLSALIEDTSQQDALKDLFLPSAPSGLLDTSLPAPGAAGVRGASPAERYLGSIQNLVEREADNKHFGFITPQAGGDNLWFGDRDLEGVAFNTLSRGDSVTYELGKNWQGPCAQHVRREA